MQIYLHFLCISISNEYRSISNIQSMRLFIVINNKKKVMDIDFPMEHPCMKYNSNLL